MASKKKSNSATHEIMVNFLSNNKDLLNNKFSSKYTKHDRVRLWKEMSLLLNSSGTGPVKTEEQWRKSFNDWKYLVRQKASRIRTHITGTGGGGPSKEVFTTEENSLLELLGETSIAGLSDVPETRVSHIDEIVGSPSGSRTSSPANFRTPTPTTLTSPPTPTPIIEPPASPEFFPSADTAATEDLDDTHAYVVGINGDGILEPVVPTAEQDAPAAEQDAPAAGEITPPESPLPSRKTTRKNRFEERQRKIVKLEDRKVKALEGINTTLKSIDSSFKEFLKKADLERQIIPLTNLSEFTNSLI